MRQENVELVKREPDAAYVLGQPCLAAISDLVAEELPAPRHPAV